MAYDLCVLNAVAQYLFGGGLFKLCVTVEHFYYALCRRESIIDSINKGINNGKKIAFIDLKLRGGGI